MAGTARGPARKLRPKAVIDKVVNGVVVERTVVLRGNKKTRRARAVDVDSAAHALARGHLLTSEASPLPTDLTMGGKLVDATDGYRVTTRNRKKSAILKLKRPLAHHLKGDVETHVYAGGRVRRLKKLPDLAGDATAAAPAPKQATTPKAPVARRSSVDTQIDLVDDLGNPTGIQRRARLRFYPGDTSRVVVEVAGAQPMWVEREHLATDLKRARGNVNEHIMINGLAGEVFRFTADEVASLIGDED